MAAAAPAQVQQRSGVDLYARFALAGALGCSITHAALCPVDVVKTRIQLEPARYNKGMISAFRTVVKEEGAMALATGLGPTAAGYFIQGALKFGGYEFWKKRAIEYMGIEAAREHRIAIYLGSSAIAEFFADVALCPLEATRIRLVSQPDFAKGLVGAFTRLWREEGVIRGFYSGFIPILFKQIPYTMAKFAVQEQSAEMIYRGIGKSRAECSDGMNTGVYLASGLIAGTASAIISQPADTLLSLMNKQKDASGGIMSRLIKTARDTGIVGLFGGLGPRIVMVATLTAGQFAIYGDIKRILGATGGAEIMKK